MKMTATKVLVL